MKLTSRPLRVSIDGSELRLRRTTGGVVEIWGNDDVDLAKGVGFAHAHDRLVQMMLARLAGQGRLSECLRADDETLGVDVFMRQMGFARAAATEAQRLSPAGRRMGEAYTAGVNYYLEHHGLPWEFKLLGYRPEPWQTADTLLTIMLMSYVGLAQTQQDLEKFIIQAIRRGVDLDRLRQLFAPHLDGLDAELCELIGRAQLYDPLIPHLQKLVPAMSASNNWAVAGRRSVSGSTLQCNDPHLECNRLPALWYETVLHTADDYRIGVNMPGVPGMAMGRTRWISLGFTYGFMDMIDYFVEEVRGGCYRRGEAYRQFEKRRELIERKGGPPVTVTIFENDIGVLECDSQSDAPEDGLYLSRAYTGARTGAAASLDALSQLGRAKDVTTAQQIVREVAISCNWVIADRQGSIGYQQSGLAPVRRDSGLYPLPAWEEQSVWRGLVPAERLSTLLNPEEGFIVTANDDWNQRGKPQNINVSMGPDRAERVRELLRERERLTVADMQRIQTDLLSLQAQRYMDVLRPLIPNTAAGRVLADWDLRYDGDSRGAVLFEAFYEELLREVFGTGLFGADLWDQLVRTTALATTYFYAFDQILLGEDESWFGEEGRDGLFTRLVSEVTSTPLEAVGRWGDERQVMMANIMLAGAGSVGRWLGIDRGPVELQGNRSTVVQGAIFHSHGRQTTFVPSYRMVADLGTEELRTVLAGGPSGRPFSKWYAADVQRWLGFEYKTLSGDNGASADMRSR